VVILLVYVRGLSLSELYPYGVAKVLKPSLFIPI
jgi:hypothetical protein